jgi:hypothetical protein
MRTAVLPPRIKERGNWIAAGDGFREAVRVLSDGAFRLFAYLSLQADCRTGRVVTTYKALAAALSKSKRAIGVYAAELNEKGVCKVRRGENQYSATSFEIGDNYWPYEREAPGEACDSGNYVAAVRNSFLALGCTRAGFSAADARAARELERQGVALQVVDDALLIGACRKYASWLEGRESAPIGSLKYFSSVIAEVQSQPFPPGYGSYLSRKVKKLAATWARQNRSTTPPRRREDPGTEASLGSGSGEPEKSAGAK